MIPLIKYGGIQRFKLSDAELAIMVSSHNGEEVHRNTVRGILRKGGLSEADMFCGSHLPYYENLIPEYLQECDDKARQFHHNCSGKHAGMLLTCLLLGYPIKDYWEADHPVQKKILDEFKNFLGQKRSSELSLGIDGCGVPNYFLPLKIIASVYQDLFRNEHLSVISNAIKNEPYMLAGAERLDTIIIEECGFIAKSGSEGLFCISIPEERIGVALKVDSGNDDISESAIIRLLEVTGLLNSEKLQIFDRFKNYPIYTSTKVRSGQFKPCF